MERVELDIFFAILDVILSAEAFARNHYFLGVFFAIFVVLEMLIIREMFKRNETIPTGKK